MSHSICIIHVATSRLPIQRLLAWRISKTCSHRSRGCQSLPRHTIMCNSLGSTWKSRSYSGEHWKGAPHSWEHWKGVPPFVSRQCFPNTQRTRGFGESILHRPGAPAAEVIGNTHNHPTVCREDSRTRAVIHGSGKEGWVGGTSLKKDETSGSGLCGIG